MIVFRARVVQQQTLKFSTWLHGNFLLSPSVSRSGKNLPAKGCEREIEVEAAQE
jgi:hypothetical protein